MIKMRMMKIEYGTLLIRNLGLFRKGGMKIMVYVLDHHGTPMMPTTRYGKVRRMLNNGQAKVIKRCPFTIKLLYETKTHVVQPITMGIDPHKSAIGISCLALYEDCSKEVYASEIIPRQDVGMNIRKCKELRQARRRRNKKRNAKCIVKGGNAPKQKKVTATNHSFGFETLRNIKRVTDILPIDMIHFEVAEYPRKRDFIDYFPRSYQMFESKRGFRLVGMRKEVFNRDRYTCQWCGNRGKGVILCTNHITNADDEGNDMYYDSIDGVVTLCKSCNEKYKKIVNGCLEKKKSIRTRKNMNQLFKANYVIRKNRDRNHASHNLESISMKYMLLKVLMIERKSIGVRWVRPMYGTDTCIIRHKYDLEFSPVNNARVLAFTPNKLITQISDTFYIKARKHHNRSLHKITPSKGGIRSERTPYILKGFCSFDLVRYIGTKHKELTGKEFYITKRRRSGYFGIGRADGTTILNSVKFDQLKLIKRRGTYSIERISI